MEPIISPALIYLIGISSNIQWLCNLLAGVAISFAVVATTIYLVAEIDAYRYDVDKQNTVLIELDINR